MMLVIAGAARRVRDRINTWMNRQRERRVPLGRERHQQEMAELRRELVRPSTASSSERLAPR